jgi:amidohydrolase
MSMKSFLFLVAVLCSHQLLAQPINAHSKRIESIVNREFIGLEQLYVNLHRNPELSQKEEKTSRVMAEQLKSLGYEVYEKIGGYGVAGVFRNGAGPTVLVRTDMDALPIEEKTGLPYASSAKSTNAAGAEVSVMHACGHDVHMTVFIGAARVLVEMKKTWKGTLVMIAQPSEENGVGAEAMLKDGLYNKVPYPDYALALHNHAAMKAGTIGYSAGPFMASVDMMNITVYGKGGHGAAPHQAVDPIVLSAQMILAFQNIVSREINPLEPAVITVGSIHGGTVHNIIPDEVRLQLTLRSYSPDVRKQIITAIEHKSKYLALQAGLPESRTPVVSINPPQTPSTINDKELTLKLVSIFKQVMNPEDVIEMPPSMIGEDFSRFATYKKQVPFSMFWLGTVDPKDFEKSKIEGTVLPTLHSSTFKPSPEPTIKTGIKALSIGALQLLQ